MSTQDRILSAASDNFRILASLASVEYAPSALKQQSLYIADLKNQLVKTEVTLKTLSAKTSSERKDHEKYANSTVRRLAYKVGGKQEKFDEKAMKGEREYIEALHEELNEKSNRDMLRHNLDEANKTRVHIEKAAKQYTRFQADLDALYNSIFAGETPEFPEEDSKEEATRQLGIAYDNAQQRLQAESQTVAILGESEKYMKIGRYSVEEALRSSNMDIFGIGGSYADFIERNALSRAEQAISRVQMLISQAQRIQPRVHPLGPMRIAQGNFVSDILFDNVFSDINFHNKIQASHQELVRAEQNLVAQLQTALWWEKELRWKTGEAAAALEASRSELQRIRRETFERVVNGLDTGVDVGRPTAGGEEEEGAQPPSYDVGRPPQYEASPPRYEG